MIEDSIYNTRLSSRRLANGTQQDNGVRLLCSFLKDLQSLGHQLKLVPVAFHKTTYVRRMLVDSVTHDDSVYKYTLYCRNDPTFTRDHARTEQNSSQCFKKQLSI